MKHQEAESSPIIAVGYDADRHVLELELEDRSVYRYFMVPRSVFEAFLAASSKNRFVDTKIKSVYACRRV
jgi:hypothetical protein